MDNLFLFQKTFFTDIRITYHPEGLVFFKPCHNALVTVTFVTGYTRIPIIISIRTTIFTFYHLEKFS
jgi:hypothetical protein